MLHTSIAIGITRGQYYYWILSARLGIVLPLNVISDY